ncbi:MAG: FAD-dependent oxidoreductase, partial [Victivallales bacterium]
TACLRIMNWNKLGNINLRELIENNRSKYPGLPCGYHWGMTVPGSDMYLLFGTRVLNSRLLDGEGFTAAEMESRSQADAIMCLLRDIFPKTELSLQGLPAYLGIRETAHINSLYMLPGDEMISGKHYEDAIANGTYPIDIHDDSSDQIFFRRLDGAKHTCRNNVRHEEKCLPADTKPPTFYQIPLRSLIPGNSVNVLSAGRMIDADRYAFGAVRVMVNLNQCGEAAGCSAVQMLES